MERCLYVLTGLIGFLMILLAGCGDGSSQSPTASLSGQQQVATPINSAASKTPQGAVTAFLDAVRRGHRDAARSMLTSLAIQKTEECNLHFAPPGSDTAEFQVGKVHNKGQGIAHVESVWTDSGEDGERRPENITWTVKQAGSVWKISGMIAEIGPNQPPVVINFEQPDELLRRQEIAAEQPEPNESRQATRPEDPFQAAPRQ